MHIAERSRLTWHDIKFDKNEALAIPSPYRPRTIREGTQKAKQPYNFNNDGGYRLNQARISTSSLADTPLTVKSDTHIGHVHHEDETAMHFETWSAFKAVSG
jgi:hypothetical protein